MLKEIKMSKNVECTVIAFLEAQDKSSEHTPVARTLNEIRDGIRDLLPVGEKKLRESLNTLVQGGLLHRARLEDKVNSPYEYQLIVSLAEARRAGYPVPHTLSEARAALQELIRVSNKAELLHKIKQALVLRSSNGEVLL